MKKKVIGIILSSMVAFSLVACGGSDESAATQNEPVVEEEKDDETAVDDDTTDTSTDEEEEVAATEDFTILDVTTDLVDVGIYAVDENNTEYVITLFRDPDDNSYTDGCVQVLNIVLLGCRQQVSRNRDFFACKCNKALLV